MYITVGLSRLFHVLTQLTSVEMFSVVMASLRYSNTNRTGAAE